MIGERNIYSVSDVNRYIKSVISQDENLKFISVRGELSNFKHGANGHLYFSLKDKDSLINCAMFATYASKLIFEPKDGDEVELDGTTGEIVVNSKQKNRIETACDHAL